MGTIIELILIILAGFLFIKIISAPIRLLFKLLLNAVTGLLMLFIFNSLAQFFGFRIETTLINCLISGIFGIPGVIFLIIVKILF